MATARRLAVNPTRMELTIIRRRLTTAVRGHSLLKDKLEGLMQEFMAIIEKYKQSRRVFEKEYPSIMRRFALAGLTGSPEGLDAAIEQGRGEINLKLGSRNITGVSVPHFEAEVAPGKGYSLLDTPLDFDEALSMLREYFPRMLELAEQEQSIWLLIAEIERTRRRVNALEHVMIPSLRETVRYIKSKLDEDERSNTVRLMKIKEMRLAQQRREIAERREKR